MALIIEFRYSWEGGCVRRIQKATATLVEAAQKNIRIIGRDDSDAARYGFPQELMATDFRGKAFTLATELLAPGLSSPAYLPPAEFPATKDLPIEIKAALEWLANVFGQQMDFWGWGEEDEATTIDDYYEGSISENPTPSDQTRFSRLVYAISEWDLGRLQRCRERLDEAVTANPQIDSSSRESPSVESGGLATLKPSNAPAGGTPTPQEPSISGLVRVARLSGGEALVNLFNSSRWTGSGRWPPKPYGFECTFFTSLFRSPGGRWFLEERYEYDVLSTCEWDGFMIRSTVESPPDNQYREIGIEAASRWFMEEWSPPTTPVEEIPKEVLTWIGSMSFDAEIELGQGCEALQSGRGPRSSNPAKPKPLRTPKSNPKRWQIIRILHERVARNDRWTVRSIAKEAGCSAGYVSKVIAGLPLKDRDQLHRGFKDDSGGLEAIA